MSGPSFKDGCYKQVMYLLQSSSASFSRDTLLGKEGSELVAGLFLPRVFKTQSNKKKKRGSHQRPSPHSQQRLLKHTLLLLKVIAIFQEDVIVYAEPTLSSDNCHDRGKAWHSMQTPFPSGCKFGLTIFVFYQNKTFMNERKISIPIIFLNTFPWMESESSWKL